MALVGTNPKCKKWKGDTMKNKKLVPKILGKI
jgi:hypothetical protein